MLLLWWSMLISACLFLILWMFLVHFHMERVVGVGLGFGGMVLHLLGFGWVCLTSFTECILSLRSLFVVCSVSSGWWVGVVWLGGVDKMILARLFWGWLLSWVSCRNWLSKSSMHMSSAVAPTPLGPASMLVGVELLTCSGGTMEFCLDVCLVIGGVLRGLELSILTSSRDRKSVV